MDEQETVIYEVLAKAHADGTLSQTQDARALAPFFLRVAIEPKSSPCKWVLLGNRKNGTAALKAEAGDDIPF
jgi:hypothetical protein